MSDPQDVPIVMVVMDEGVGGSEKRLTEIWQELAPRLPNLRLIVRASTFAELIKRPDLRGLLDHRDRIELVEVAGGRTLSTLRAFAPILWRLPPGAVVHHILKMPPLLHRLRAHRSILSWTMTTFPRLKATRAGLNSWLMSLLSVRSATHIDVLNPDVLAELKSRFTLGARASLTAGGTFVDFKLFRPAARKSDTITYLGTQLHAKGVLRFAEAIPLVDRALKERGIAPKFVICGDRGDASNALDAMVAGPDYAGIDLSIGSTSDPGAVLGDAKVFVSLQTPSNYPSKSLAEAMACGCVPVITDGRESRLMANPANAVYINEKFTAAQLSEAIVALLLLDDERFAARSAAVREDAKARFSLATQADYFEALYRRMSVAEPVV